MKKRIIVLDLTGNEPVILASSGELSKADKWELDRLIEEAAARKTNEPEPKELPLAA
jgi:hypothetical protein